MDAADGQYIDQNTSLTKGGSKFPKIAYLIVFAELCERFSYSGMRAFLALYLKQKLYYTDDGATELYHIFATMAYFFPICGAVIADSYLGKYRTILYLMIIYALGNVAVTLGSMPLGLPPKELTVAGLMLVAMGTGGIKPCVAAFGGDQFLIPEQSKELAVFFIYYYFAICIGSLAAKVTGPLLRAEFQCFGEKDCYSLAFGAPGILMLFGVVILVSFKRYYIMKNPTGNVVLKSVQCVYSAIKQRVQNKCTNQGHWLDSSTARYGQKFVEDLKSAGAVLRLFLALPFFWALLDQMGSRWTLQASRMNGDFGFITVRPDQITVVNPIIIIVAIPLFQQVLYPQLAKINVLVKPYHKIILGIFLSILAFVCSGLVELVLQRSQPLLPSKDTGQLRIFNTFNCNMKIQLEGEQFPLKPLEFHTAYYTNIEQSRNVRMHAECDQSKYIFNITVEPNLALSYVIGGSANPEIRTSYIDSVAKPRTGFPLIRFIQNFDESVNNISLYDELRHHVEISFNNTAATSQYEVYASNYTLYIDGAIVASKIKLRVGGVYALAAFAQTNNKMVIKLLEITAPNSMSMIWLLPQLLLISIGEILVAATGQEFAFKEAPESMKSLIQAGWILTEAFGNVIIILVTRLAADYNQALQAFAYAGFTTVSMAMFFFMARNYEKRNKYDGELAEKTPLQENNKDFKDPLVAKYIPSNEIHLIPTEEQSGCNDVENLSELH